MYEQNLKYPSEDFKAKTHLRRDLVVEDVTGKSWDAGCGGGDAMGGKRVGVMIRFEAPVVEEVEGVAHAGELLEREV